MEEEYGTDEQLVQAVRLIIVNQIQTICSVGFVMHIVVINDTKIGKVSHGSGRRTGMGGVGTSTKAPRRKFSP